VGKTCVALILLSFAAAGNEVGYTPVFGYAEQEILGWKVLLNKDFSGEHPDLASDVLRLLEHQLYQITRVVPEAALKELRRQNIWVEYEDRNFPCMCYHPSAEWLSKNGYNPDKEGDIEICGARKFLQWTKDQPWMVLHELAHGYHDLVLGYNNPQIRQAYEKAVADSKYESVLHINGRKQKAYALNNAKEYFAETAEAYFGTNDFYPFVRSELKESDPDAYELHKKLWNLNEEAN
jgi:hypothetical protein